MLKLAATTGAQVSYKMGCSGPWSNGRTPVFGTGGGGSNPPGPIFPVSCRWYLLELLGDYGIPSGSTCMAS